MTNINEVLWLLGDEAKKFKFRYHPGQESLADYSAKHMKQPATQTHLTIIFAYQCLSIDASMHTVSKFLARLYSEDIH